MTQDTGNQDGVQWGPEIVNASTGRPDFVLPADMVMDVDPGRHTDGVARKAAAWGWYAVKAFRLHANHPYYATLKQEENPTRTPAQVARMEALVRAVADVRGTHDAPGAWFGIDSEIGDEARAIVAELDPVDPVEAIVDELMQKDCTTRQAITEAVHRGRELQKRGEG